MPPVPVILDDVVAAIMKEIADGNPDRFAFDDVETALRYGWTCHVAWHHARTVAVTLAINTRRQTVEVTVNAFYGDARDLGQYAVVLACAGAVAVAIERCLQAPGAPAGHDLKVSAVAAANLQLSDADRKILKRKTGTGRRKS